MPKTASPSTVTVVTIIQTTWMRACPRTGGPSTISTVRLRNETSAYPKKSRTKMSTGVNTAISTWLSKTWPVAWTLPFPGGIAGPR